MTAELSATADGHIFPPLVIFKRKPDQTIHNLNILLNSPVKHKRKCGWMMIRWKFGLKKIGSNMFKLNVRSKCNWCNWWSEESIARGEHWYFSHSTKYQPMNVCINKLFKAILQKCWIIDVLSVVESFRGQADQDSSFKLPVVTRHYLVDWNTERFHHLAESQEIEIFPLMIVVLLHVILKRGEGFYLSIIHRKKHCLSRNYIMIKLRTIHFLLAMMN